LVVRVETNDPFESTRFHSRDLWSRRPTHSQTVCNDVSESSWWQCLVFQSTFETFCKCHPYGSAIVTVDPSKLICVLAPAITGAWKGIDDDNSIVAEGKLSTPILSQLLKFITRWWGSMLLQHHRHDHLFSKQNMLT